MRVRTSRVVNAALGVAAAAVLTAGMAAATPETERQAPDRADDPTVLAAGFDDLVILDQFAGSTFITSVGTAGTSRVGTVGFWPAAGTRLLGGNLFGGDIGDAVIVREIATGFQLWGIPWNDTDGVYDADADSRTVWATVSTGGFSFDRSRQLMGDVTGDGYDDIVTIHHQLTGGLRVWVHPNAQNGTFAAPQQWQNLSTGGWSYQNSRQTLADVDGDADMDLVSTHRQSTGGLILWAHLSDTTAFATPTQWENLTTGGWSFDNSRQVGGDIDGDGLDDVVTSHRQSNGGLVLWAHLSDGVSSFDSPALWQDLRTGGWSYANSQQHLLDVDGDGLDDVMSAHRASGNLYRLWMHFSTGSSFDPPLLLWAPTPDFPYDGTEFAVSRF